MKAPLFPYAFHISPIVLEACGIRVAIIEGAFKFDGFELQSRQFCAVLELHIQGCKGGLFDQKDGRLNIAWDDTANQMIIKVFCDLTGLKP